MILRIKTAILQDLPDAEVYVYDPDGQHFEAIVVSAEFVGLPLLKQHQRVMKALKAALETDVHSILLKTFTPEDWGLKKHQYSV